MAELVSEISNEPADMMAGALPDGWYVRVQVGMDGKAAVADQVHPDRSRPGVPRSGGRLQAVVDGGSWSVRLAQPDERAGRLEPAAEMSGLSRDEAVEDLLRLAIMARPPAGSRTRDERRRLSGGTHRPGVTDFKFW